jgi:single-strand DNA-binding protein
MNDINQVLLKGAVSRTPDVKNLGNDKTVCNFSVMTTRKWNENEFKGYHKVVAWNAVADASKDLVEGDRVLVMGELQTRSYDKDGTKVWVTEVNAKSVERMGNEREDPSDISHGMPQGDSFDGSDDIHF